MKEIKCEISNELKKTHTHYTEVLNGGFKYMYTRVMDSNGKRYYYISARCIRCNEIRMTSSATFKKGKVKCACQDVEKTDISALRYAKELYKGIYKEVSEMGFIAEKDLDGYIDACVQYDRPGSYSERYKSVIKKYILEKYKKYDLVECEVCDICVEKKKTTYKKNIRVCMECAGDI